MADYYPLLNKAVSVLKISTPQSRGVIYERARKVMLEQLRGMQPPMSEDAIERETHALEDAIFRLERGFFYFPPVAAPKSPPNPEISHSAGSSRITIRKNQRLALTKPTFRFLDRPIKLDIFLNSSRVADFLNSFLRKINGFLTGRLR